MRFHILRALVVKEVRRHVANRGGLALAGLLVAAAVLLSAFNPTQVDAGAAGGDLVGGVHHCYVEYADDTPFVTALKEKVPPGLKAQVVFRRVKPGQVAAPLSYAAGTGAIRVAESDRDGTPRLLFDVWHPPGDPAAMAAYEHWFFRAAREVLHDRAARAVGDAARLPRPDVRDDDLWAVQEAFRALDAEVERLRPATQAPRVLPAVEIRRNGLGAKPLDYRSAVATALVVFALYFTCCYLLPTLNCEERERGVLLAQALSPASPAEIVAAKFLFYPVAGVGLAAALAGIYNPAVLGTLFFWLALLALGGGFLGIGMTVSTLAKTQRAAFLGSMCYLLSVSLLLFICSQNGIPFLSQLAIESHGPKILHAAMTQSVEPADWVHLLAAFGLAAGWMTLAGWLFRRRGWQ
jgi:hypothetical protein